MLGIDQVEVARIYVDGKPVPLLTNDLGAVVNEYSDIINGLDFEPDAQHTIADMANCGRSMMSMIAAVCGKATWSNSPAEVIGDLAQQVEDLQDSLDTLYRLFQTIASDAEATYEAAKENKPLAISIGQFRRLTKACELVSAIRLLNPEIGTIGLKSPALEEQPDGTVTAVDPTDKGLTS